jgi:hypothetical protein
MGIALIFFLVSGGGSMLFVLAVLAECLGICAYVVATPLHPFNLRIHIFLWHRLTTFRKLYDISSKLR